MQNIGLIEKIQRLPVEKIREVEDFVEFLDQKQTNSKFHGSSEPILTDLEVRDITRESAAEQRAALMTFADDWDHPDMQIYDEI
jgi:hypothetical protein